MATIINNPGNEARTDGGADSAAGMVIGIIIAIVLIALFVIYGLPALRQGGAANTTDQPDSTNVNISVPNPVSSPTSPSSN